MKTIIEARNITEVYGKKGRSTHSALNGLSFSMKEEWILFEPFRRRKY